MSSNSVSRVAVIDVGSNSIKLLVTSKGDTEPLKVDCFSIRETRIGEGITGTPPTLDQSAIERGTQAIAELVEESKSFHPTHTAIVATSAVRDAINRDELINAVECETGIRLDVLSGEQEAQYIGKGIQCDPALKDLKDFTLLDLGGGSLECIQFENGDLTSANSLQLGAVRLTNLFEIDRALPLSTRAKNEIERHTKQSLESTALNRKNSHATECVLTGGASAIVSDYFKVRVLSREEINGYTEKIVHSNREERIEQLSVPSSRADIIAAAMTTISATLEYFDCRTVHFSRYNLRYGIAQALLSTGKF